MGALDLLAAQLAQALRPLSIAMRSDGSIRRTVANLGWTLPFVPPSLPAMGGNLAQMYTSLADMTVALRRSEMGDGASSEVAEALRDLAVDLGLVVNDLHALPGRLRAELPPAFVATTHIDEQIEGRLFDWLLSMHLANNAPILYRLLRVAGVIEATDGQVEPDIFQPLFEGYRIRWERFLQLLDPKALAQDVYGWGTPSIDTDRLFRELVPLSFALGMPSEFRYASPEFNQRTATGADPGSVPLPQLWIPVVRSEEFTFFIVAAALAKGSPDELQGLALVLAPSANGDLSVPIGDTLELAVHADAQVGTGAALILRPDAPPDILLDIEGAAGGELTGGSITAALTRQAAEWEKPEGISAGSGTKLSARNVSLRLGATAAGGRADVFAELNFDQVKLVVAPPNDDGFLTSVTPQEGLSATFSLTVRWSRDGLHFQGSAGLAAVIPLHQNLGQLTLHSLDISVRSEDQKIDVQTLLTANIQLGPLKLAIQGIGLKMAGRTTPGNLGPLDVQLGFKPPDGIGLEVDGRGFTGGGFLRFIEADQRYEGMLELEYEDKITLKAIGLLTTHLPDGRPGFSLLIIISAEFNPIQLGLGFTLNGVGGLLGLNRTADVERLRTGVRDSTLSSVLFPQNVIANASRILSDLQQVFPVQTGRFIFGPMARIGWGTPTLLTIDLGLLIEIPDPVRVIILGVIRALLPDEDLKLLQLNVNFLGVIDFEAQRLSFDASLYDSKLLSFTLSGDISVRLSWGDNPNFLLTVGGFHPSYNPPPLNLPVLRRLSLQLTASDNPRLTLETYFAITSNTVQFGAKIELLAKAGSFSVYGFLSFDVLFQFNPFYFIADISAKLALRAGSSEIASISLDLSLEGPTPWHAKGTAKFKICWFLTIKVHFDKTFGEERNTRLDDVPVLPLLQAALSDRGNWEAQLPGNRHQLVSFKALQAGEVVVVFPSGVLTIQQRVVPLAIDIQRFGSQQPADGHRFAIERVLAGEGSTAEPLATSAVDELFAPAQFFELSDAQKLSSKSFERYDSGVKLVDSESLDSDYAVQREVAYELFYIDDQRDLQPQGKPLQPDILTFYTWALQGAIADLPLSHARNAKSALAPGAVQVIQEGFAVVNTRDLRQAIPDMQATSKAGAQSLMEGLLRSNPALEGEVQVVPSFEVNRG